MKTFYIQNRGEPHHFAKIDCITALRNWAEQHQDFSKYRFYEADTDRFIIAPREINPNPIDNAEKLVNTVLAHFERIERMN